MRENRKLGIEQKDKMELKDKIKAISIGYLGSQLCFLGVSKEEAIKRYKEVQKYTDEDLEGLRITEGYIVDGMFWVYEIGLEDEEATEL